MADVAEPTNPPEATDIPVDDSEDDENKVRTPLPSPSPPPTHACLHLPTPADPLTPTPLRTRKSCS